MATDDSVPVKAATVDSTKLTLARDVALIVVAALGSVAAIAELRPYKPISPLPPLPLAPRPAVESLRTVDAGRRPNPQPPQPDHGWLYEMCSYADDPRRVRPAVAAEQAATEATRHVDGTGIFACLADGSVIRSDEDAYPPPPRSHASYRWVAP